MTFKDSLNELHSDLMSSVPAGRGNISDETYAKFKDMVEFILANCSVPSADEIAKIEKKITDIWEKKYNPDMCISDWLENTEPMLLNLFAVVTAVRKNGHLSHCDVFAKWAITYADVILARDIK